MASPLRWGRGSWLLAVALVATACAAESPAATSTPPAGAGGATVSVSGGTLTKIFPTPQVAASATNLLIYATVPLPDGTVVIGFDPETPEAGADDENSGAPQMLTLKPDGSTEPFEAPVIDGQQISAGTEPLAAGPDGTLYVWDADRFRILQRGPDDVWTVLAKIPSSLVNYSRLPRVAVSRDGTVYVQTDASVFRMGADGTRELVVGSAVPPKDGFGPEPEPLVSDVPRPATSKQLPRLLALAIGNDGTIFVTTKSSVLAVDSAGTLTIAADPNTTTADGDGRIKPQEWVNGRLDGSTLASLAVDADGAILVGDTGTQRVLRIENGHTTVLLDVPGDDIGSSVTAVANGSVVSESPSNELIVSIGGGASVAAYRR